MKSLCSGKNASTAPTSVRPFCPTTRVNKYSDFYTASSFALCQVKSKLNDFFFPENSSEELLNLHESESQRLKQHFEDHKELFEGVHKWEEGWRLFLELEVS